MRDDMNDQTDGRIPLRRRVLSWLLEQLGETAGQGDRPAGLPEDVDEDPVLTRERDEPDCNDYILRQSSCWIEAGSLAVWIRQDDEGVMVDICLNGQEAAYCLASTGARFDEAEEIQAL